MDQLHLFGAQHPAHPHEAAAIGEAALQLFGIHLRKDRRQFAGDAGGIDHVPRLHIERMGLHVGGQNPAIAVGDVGAAGQNLGPAHRRARLYRVSPGQNAHPHPDHGVDHHEPEAQHQKPEFGPPARAVAQHLVPQAQVFTLDRIGVFASGAGLQNPGQRAQRGADHGKASASAGAVLMSPPVSPNVFTGFSMTRLSGGSG